MSDGEVRVDLRLGDCLDVLPTLEAGSVDAVITDPPYGIGYQSSPGSSSVKGSASWVGKEICGDNSTKIRDKALSLLDGKPMAVFGSWKAERPKATRAILVWDKGPAFGMGDLTFPWKNSWEEIYIIGDGWRGKRDGGVYFDHRVVSWESRGRTHPNEKPVSLLMELIKKLPDAQTIVDPFMGTGATGIACMKLGRNFIGIERDEGYFAIAQRRIEQAQAQMTLPLFPSGE